MDNTKEFKIGITMAGAVSAGAYTAGVIDYLLETMEKWQQMKDRGVPDIPKHNVVIQTISGASAGGITAALMPFVFKSEYRPVNRQNMKKEHNLLYDCWVNMDDDDSGETYEKLLASTDIDEYKEVRSILNSQPIDNIAEKALNLSLTKKDFPKYISPELDIILTITNLRGLNFNIDFKQYLNSVPTKITMHSGYFRYKFTAMRNVGYQYIDLDLEKHQKMLIEAAKCTSAFPVGLSARTTKISTEHIKRYVESLFPNHKDSVKLDKEVLAHDKYEFVAVDGGMINNEPLGYTYKFMKEDADMQNREENNSFAIILVDPFPKYGEEAPEKKMDYSLRTRLLDVIPNLLGTLRNQVMFKQDDLFKAISDEDTSRFLIAPARKVNGERVDNPLACGAMGGFSGFFDKRFRQSDFQLGRKNCQDFIRYYFAFKESDNHYIHEDWTPEMKKRFRFWRYDKDKNKVYFLPIIPDPTVLRAEYEAEYSRPNEHLPPFPSITADRLNHIEKLLKLRFRRMAKQLFIDYRQGNGENMGWFTTWLLSRKLVHRFIANRIAKKARKIIDKSFRDYGLL